MEPLSLNKEEYLDLLEIQAEAKYGKLACNRNREVWPKPGLGYTQPKDRDHKKGHNRVLDEIVLVVLRKRYEAGDFYVNREGVFLAVDDRQIVEFIPEYDWEDDW